MAEPLTPKQLIDALDKWGVDYELYPDWKTRTSAGDSNPIGFTIHHTGGPFTESDNYLDFLFNRGRPGIPGPLCNFSIGPSGKVYVGSLGNANHAGRGDWTTRQLVGSESYNGYSEEIDPGADDYGTGNDLFWGAEINYPGTVPMKPAQRKSAVRLSAALMDAFSEASGSEWSALSTIAHREHSSRKWDPGQEEMDAFRRDVRDLLRAGPGGDMSYDEVMRTDNKAKAPPEWATDTNTHWWVESLVERMAETLADLRDRKWSLPYFPDNDKINLQAMERWSHSRLKYLEPIIERTAEQVQALHDRQQGDDGPAIMAKIDERYNEAAVEREALAEQITDAQDALEGANARLNQLGQLMTEFDEDFIDEDAVIEGFRKLLHTATAPVQEAA